MINNFTFLKKESFFDPDIVNKLLILFDDYFKKNDLKSGIANVRELRPKEIESEPLLRSVYEKIFLNFKEILNNESLKFNKLWMVSSESKDTDDTRLPYIPHFDKLRFLKAMIYLHDVSYEHGPIHLGNAKSNSDIESKRQSLPINYQEKLLNCLSNDNLENQLLPMLGKAGDVIFFDTNAPHKAGIVKSGFIRKVIRFDFEMPYFNQTPTSSLSFKIKDFFQTKLKNIR